MFPSDRTLGKFDRKNLAEICVLPERDFGRAFDMERVAVAQRKPSNFYYYKDNGSDILAVAHLDTVAPANTRRASFAKTQAGLIVHSRALDDRLGAYVILDLLPRLDVTCDWLLTVGEESGESTADFFDTHKGYNWVIEFDRGGTDVVMYQYEDYETAELVKASGAKVGVGIFSDICYLESLGVKAFNWGVGYREYHYPRSHAYLNDTLGMVDLFLNFHDANSDTYLPHTPRRARRAEWWETEKECEDCYEPLEDCQCYIPRSASRADEDNGWASSNGWWRDERGIWHQDSTGDTFDAHEVIGSTSLSLSDFDRD